jgi:AAA15 family ATPase/GTPase
LILQDEIVWKHEVLIEFSVENYKSFKERIEFSMLATEDSNHSDRVFKLPFEDGSMVLPIASIYGGNASGKSNFVSALKTLQFIVLNDQVPHVDPFILETGYSEKETTFDIKILIDKIVYRYTVSTAKAKIIKERLAKVNGSNNEDRLYMRDGHKIDSGKLDDQQTERIKFLINNSVTPDNQTFLKRVAAFGIFNCIWEWFKDSLLIIDSSFNNIINEENVYANDINDQLNEILFDIDTGISRIGKKEVNVELDSKTVAQIYNGKTLKLDVLGNGGYIRIRNEKGKIVSELFGTFHVNQMEEEIFLGLMRESDGSKRVISLLPAFIKIMFPNSNKLLLIDEFDRGLHTELTSSLIERYLNECRTKNTRSQLIITTHDVQLLDLNIFRRDEVWFMERKRGGISDMFPLCSFKDNGKDMKEYLQGKFGGIPKTTHFI